jgi:hypothetical protein
MENTPQGWPIETDKFTVTSIAGDSFFSPIVAAVICIETLLSQLFKQLGDKAIQRLIHTVYVLEKLGTEI